MSKPLKKMHQSDRGEWVECGAEQRACPKKGPNGEPAEHIWAENPEHAAEISAARQHPDSMFPTTSQQSTKPSDGTPLPGGFDFRGKNDWQIVDAWDSSMKSIREGRYDYADITVDDDSDGMAEWAHNLGYQAKAIGDNKVRLYNTAELPSHEGFSSEDMYNSVGWHTAQCRELGIPRVWEGRSDIYLHMIASDNPRHKDVLFKEMHDHVDKAATKYLNDESTSEEAGLRAEAADRVKSGQFSTEPPVRTTFHEGPDGERVPDIFGDWNHEVERIWESSPRDRHALKNRAPFLIDTLRRGDAKTFREQMDALKEETTDINW